VTTHTVVIIAKAPVAGRVKTRLCPPLDPRSAARLAEAALRDTLAQVAGLRDARRVVALDGIAGPWLTPDFDVVAQRGGGLDERIAHVLDACDGPTLVVGMDTPQLRLHDLEHAFAQLDDGADAVVGPACDGGYWLLGLAVPDARAVLGVPMSTATTLAEQRARLDALGLSTAALRVLRDVDHYDDALAVAREAPSSRFAHALADVVDDLDRAGT
jgi:rSAM/selenodomain-associated transferase 1